MDRLLADLQADLQTTIYAAFEDNKNILLGQTARAVLSDALFERIRNDVERLKNYNRMRKKLRPQILSCERAFIF